MLTWRGQTMGAQASLVLHHPDGRHAARLRDDVLAEMRRLERIFSGARAYRARRAASAPSRSSAVCKALASISRTGADGA